VSNARWERFVADDTVDHRVDFTLRQPVYGQGSHMRPSDPRWFELRPERHDQEHAKGAKPVHCPTDGLQARWVGPVRILEDHQHWVGA